MTRVAPVERTTAQARTTYDRLARWYDLVEAPFERRARAAGLRLLDPHEGEHILEVGFGTGHTLAAIGQMVGATGLVVGIDQSEQMARRTRRRLTRRLPSATVGLVQADACQLPLGDATVDAITMCFTLDLIATMDIPLVLRESRRALRPGGRICVVSLDLPSRSTTMMRLYLAAHRRWPLLIDCRPLPLHDILMASGYTPTVTWTSSIFGVPVAAISAVADG